MLNSFPITLNMWKSLQQTIFGYLLQITDLVFSLLLFSDSIKLWLNEFYICQLREKVTEPTDG
jgi:hypothetical protein